MEKVKIFISQPMKGKSEAQIREEREKAIQQAKSHIHGFEVEILDSFFADKFSPDYPPLYYLGQSVLVLSEADFAYFAPGWEEARGCVIERMCCEMYGIPILG